MSADRDPRPWIQRARQGDREAFDQLVREHVGPLRSLIALQLGEGLRGRVEIDDLLQDALLRAFRSIGQLEGETGAAVRSWLAGIASHAVVDRARRLTAQKADYRREVPYPAEGSSDSGGLGSPSPPLPSPGSSPSAALRREERLERLLAALETLSSDHRQVILLSLIEQLPAKEVAQRMGRSEKAVAMLLLRAMRALKEVFGETESLTLPREPRPARLEEPSHGEP